MFARRCALFAAILAITSGPAGAINPLDGLTVTDTQSNLQPGNLTGTNNGLNNTNTGVINQLGVGNGVTFTGTGNAGLLNSGRINSQGGTQSILTSATSVIYGANAGISNAAAGTISSTALDSLRNNGTIGQSGLLLSTNGLYNAGTITNATSNRSIYNFGTITGSNAGIYNDTGGVIQNTNNGGSIANPTGGTIGGSSTTYGILNNGTIFANTGTAIQNTGTMTGSTAGIYNGTGGVIRSNSIFYVVQNVGTIGGAGSQYGIYNAGTMSNNGGASTIITNQNRGTISGTVAGIYNAAGASMTQTGAGSAAIFNDNGSTINSITNLGSMTGPLAAIFNSSASGVITTLNNAQGQASALTYRGRLPVNYNVIVNSPTDYGKLQISSPAATTNFGVSALSTLTTATYTAVLSGINSTYLANQVGGTVTGTLGAYSWTLQAESGSPTIWDLIVTCSGGCGGGGSTSAPAPAPATLTDIATGGTFGLSSIGVTTNPVFDGGTLSLTAGASTSQPFTVTALGGTIATPSGGTASMSGGLSGSGSMTINGGGTLQLSGLNTYTGGTTIDGNIVRAAISYKF